MSASRAVRIRWWVEDNVFPLVVIAILLTAVSIMAWDRRSNHQNRLALQAKESRKVQTLSPRTIAQACELQGVIWEVSEITVDQIEECCSIIFTCPGRKPEEAKVPAKDCYGVEPYLNLDLHQQVRFKLLQRCQWTRYYSRVEFYEGEVLVHPEKDLSNKFAYLYPGGV